jgi:hypothetical protein
MDRKASTALTIKSKAPIINGAPGKYNRSGLVNQENR